MTDQRITIPKYSNPHLMRAKQNHEKHQSIHQKSDDKPQNHEAKCSKPDLMRPIPKPTYTPPFIHNRIINSQTRYDKITKLF